MSSQLQEEAEKKTNVGGQESANICLTEVITTNEDCEEPIDMDLAI
jgi:hypothetical protein